MKKHFTFLAFAILLALGTTMAQTYVPIATTGYTLDGVAENTTAIGTTQAPMDNSDFVLYSQFYGTLYSTSAVGLPNNGTVVSGARTYQLQGYTGPNVLQVQANLTDSLTFVTPQAFPAISLLSFGTQGIATVSITVRFTDNSTQVFSPITFDDWFNATTPVISGFDRAQRTTGAPALVGSAGNPKMFAADLSILCANQGKLIKRVIIKNNSTAYACVMAVSGKVPPYSVTPAAPLICSGANVTLNATGLTSYTWMPAGAFAGSNSATITVSPNSTTAYTLTGDNAGCPGYTVVTVNVSSGTPTLSLTGSSQSVCLGAAATITASGAINYTLSSPAANGGTFTPSATAAYTVTGANGCGSSSVTTTISVAPLPVSVATSTSLVCAGSPATVSAGGATTYTWMPGANSQTNYIVSPTANTIYTVTGRTGNCLGTNTIAINTTPNPTLAISASNTVICAGFSSNLTVTGNALTYTWTGNQPGSAITVSPLNATLYSVTGTNMMGCKFTAAQVILVNQLPVVNASASNTLVCPGEASTLTATGANTYLWSDNSGASTTVVNPTASGIYTVTGTSTANCVSSTTVAVDVFDPVISVSGSTAVCRGSVVYLSASGMDSYQWSNGSVFATITLTATSNAAGIYTVIGTSTQDGVSCNATGTVALAVNANPTVTAAATRTAICKGETTVLNGQGAATYTWTAATPAISQAYTVSPAADQVYTVSGIDANGCKGTGTILVKVSGCVGIANNTASAINMVIYPNPANGAVNIQADLSMKLTLVNELGQPVRTLELNEANGRHATVEGLSAGIYFVTAQDAALQVKQKIVITH